MMSNVNINIKRIVTVISIVAVVAVVVSLGIVGSLSKVITFLGARLLFLFK